MFFPPTCKGRSMAQNARSRRVITEFDFAQSRKDEVRRPRLPTKGPFADEQSVIAPMSRTSRAISAFREDVPRQPSWHIGANRVNHTSERRRRVVLRPSLDIEHAITRWIHMPAIHPSPWQGQRESKPVDVPMLDSLVDLERMVKQSADLYVRYAEGWDGSRTGKQRPRERDRDAGLISQSAIPGTLLDKTPDGLVGPPALPIQAPVWGEPEAQGMDRTWQQRRTGAGLRSAFHPGRVSGQAFGCLAGK